jgi:predicted Rossmann fold flavoprotein
LENKTNNFELIVVGGGASGFFGAINAAALRPGMKILILEKTKKLLSKVKISGGGRCNVTHACESPYELTRHYPRGQKVLKRLFPVFDAQNMLGWLKAHGIETHTEKDGRIFPKSNDSQTIIDCFLNESRRLGIRIETDHQVLSIVKTDSNCFRVQTSTEAYYAEKVLITVGGHPAPSFYRLVTDLGHTVFPPIPSLFTFNDPKRGFADLMGLSVSQASVRIEGTKYSEAGPVLITHWGLSGPAVIKLSAWASEYLHEKEYRFKVLVNWTGDTTETDLRERLEDVRLKNARRKVIAFPLFSIPTRLWERLCTRAGITDEKIWAELPKKNENRLIENLIRCSFSIEGKTTFREEFVTCGGIDLNELNPDTMESKKVPNIFFAGEVLNIDGETGGFNFQSAWTTAWIAARGVTAQ